jgi:signal peptide peptidase SppA
MPPSQHIEGCRPDQLFGFWAMEVGRLQQYVALAKGADLEKLRAESRAAAERAKGTPLYQTADGIAIIDVNGPLTKYPTSFQALFGGTSMLRAREALRHARDSSDIEAIMVRVDSPGGTVAGGAELAEDIRRAAAKKPLHSYADDFAASGGLLVLSQGSKAWASTNAEVGSIGVYTVIEDSSQQYLQSGVKVHVISSAPPVKGAGVEGTEITPAQLAEWQRRVSDLADWFVGEVSLGRRMPRDQVQKLATGQIWVAAKARELGLIDGVRTFDDALAELRADVERPIAAIQSRLEQSAKSARAEENARAVREIQERADADARRAAEAAPSPPRRERPKSSKELAAEIERRASARGETHAAFLRTAEGRALYDQYRQASYSG